MNLKTGVNGATKFTEKTGRNKLKMTNSLRISGLYNDCEFVLTPRLSPVRIWSKLFALAPYCRHDDCVTGGYDECRNYEERDSY